MSYKYNVSIILVNYNGKKYIDCLFESLKKMKKGNLKFEVVFVDNASSDGSVDYLKSKEYDKHMDIRIVETGANLGFAGGNNAGVKACEGEYIILLNNDTAVTEDWLVNLYDFMKNNKDCCMANSKLLFFYDFIKITFATSDKILLKKDITINGEKYHIDNKFCKNLLYEDERLVCFGHSEISIPLINGYASQELCFDVIEASKNSQIKCEGVSMDIQDGEYILKLDEDLVTDKRFSIVQNAGSGVNENYDGYDLGFGEIDSDKFDEAYEINNGCGASIIMKKQDFVDCGMFDERFFMYYEDTDLSYRIKASGKKIMYCPNSVVRHIHTGSSTEWSPFFIYHVYRNKLLFIYKNISKGKFRKFYFKQLLSSYRAKNEMMIKGTKDAKRIIKGEENIHY